MTALAIIRQETLPAVLEEVAQYLAPVAARPSLRIESHDRLVPRDLLPAALEACERMKTPAAPREAAAAVAMLLAPYRLVEFVDPKIAAALYANLAAQYPLGAIQRAINEIHCHLKYAPSIAEFRQALDQSIAPQHRRLAILRNIEREYAGRDLERNRLRGRSSWSDLDHALEELSHQGASADELTHFIRSTRSPTAQSGAAISQLAAASRARAVMQETAQ